MTETVDGLHGGPGRLWRSGLFGEDERVQVVITEAGVVGGCGCAIILG